MPSTTACKIMSIFNDPPQNGRDDARSLVLTQRDPSVWIGRFGPFPPWMATAMIPSLMAFLCLIRLSLSPTIGMSIPSHLLLAGLAALLVAALGWIMQRQDYDPHVVVMVLAAPLLAPHNALDCIAVLTMLLALQGGAAAAGLGITLAVVVYPPFSLLALLPVMWFGRSALWRIAGWTCGGLTVTAILLLAWNGLRSLWVGAQNGPSVQHGDPVVVISMLISLAACALYFRLRRRDLLEPHPLMGLLPPILLCQMAALIGHGRLMNAAAMLAALALAIVWDMVWPLLPQHQLDRLRLACYGALLAASGATML